MIMSRTTNSNKKEREVQDMANEDIMYELLLQDIDAETLMNEEVLKLTQDHTTG